MSCIFKNLQILSLYENYTCVYISGVDFKVKTLTVDGNKTKLAIWVGNSESYHRNMSIINQRFASTVQLHYNMPQYSAIFNIKWPCYGSRIDYFAVNHIITIT